MHCSVYCIGYTMRPIIFDKLRKQLVFFHFFALKTTTMLDKASRLAKCLRSQVKEDIVIQDKSCTEHPFHKFNEHCRSCENNGPCSFKGLRGFKISKKTKSLLHGPYFPPTNKVDPLQHLKSERFTSTTFSSPLSSTSSTSPVSAAAYTIKKIKSAFNSILQRQKTITNINKPIRRENPEGDRHFCDYCYTSLFNYHYVCSVCALEICPDCYRELNTTSEDELLTCKNGIKHHPDEFVLLSKLIEESMDYLIQSTAATASDLNNVENEINHDDCKYNTKKSTYTSSPNMIKDAKSSINCTITKTNEDSKHCKYNSSVDTNTKSSTSTNIINATGTMFSFIIYSIVLILNLCNSLSRNPDIPDHYTHTRNNIFYGG